MSPILTRPVREQFEHDRVIRLLQARYRRKHEVAINPGHEQNESVMSGELSVYPDLVLFGTDRGRRLEGTIEVETGESVNYLEALSEWGPFSRLRVPFILYVPPQAVDPARRLCAEHGIAVAEIWTYHMALDQVRFTMVHRDEAAAKIKPEPRAPRASRATAAAASAKPATPTKPSKKAPKAAAKTAAKAVAKAKTTGSRTPTKSAKAGKPAGAKSGAAKSTKSAKAAAPRARTAAAKPARAAKAKKTARTAKTARPAGRRR